MTSDMRQINRERVLPQEHPHREDIRRSENRVNVQSTPSNYTRSSPQEHPHREDMRRSENRVNVQSTPSSYTQSSPQEHPHREDMRRSENRVNVQSTPSSYTQSSPQSAPSHVYTIDTTDKTELAASQGFRERPLPEQSRRHPFRITPPPVYSSFPPTPIVTLLQEPTPIVTFVHETPSFFSPPIFTPPPPIHNRVTHLHRRTQLQLTMGAIFLAAIAGLIIAIAVAAPPVLILMISALALTAGIIALAGFGVRRLA